MPRARSIRPTSPNPATSSSITSPAGRAARNATSRSTAIPCCAAAIFPTPSARTNATNGCCACKWRWRTRCRTRPCGLPCLRSSSSWANTCATGPRPRPCGNPADADRSPPFHFHFSSIESSFMAHIVILGVGTGGTPAAYEMRHLLDKSHTVTLINASDTIKFLPSNTWVALGWRETRETPFKLRPYLEEKGIRFIAQRADTIDAANSQLHLANGDVVDYDYLVIATGPRLAFDLVPGAGPESGHTQSVCTVEHAERAYADYLEFLKTPGPVVLGALPGASSYGQAYANAKALKTALRYRK